MFAYLTAFGAYGQNCRITSVKIIFPEKQWHGYSLEDLMTVFYSSKAEEEEKESMVQFCKRNPPLLWGPQAAKNINEKKKMFMSGKQ